MEKKEKELLVDPGDWYSELFNGDPNGAAPTSHTSNSKKLAGQIPEPVLSEETEESHPDTAENASLEKEKHTPGKSMHIHVYAFFCCSVIIFVLCLYYLFHADDFSTLPALHFSPPRTEYVSSYLSYSTKQNMSSSALDLLRKNGARLASLQHELETLEENKNDFIKGIEGKDKIYFQSRSIFGLTGKEKNLRSIADLVRSDVEFRGEKKRRIQIYLQQYNKKRQSLLAQKTEYEKSIGNLTAYQKTVDRIRPVKDQSFDSAFLVDTLRSGYLSKFMYSVEHEDYDGALSALRFLKPLSPRGEDMTMKLIHRLVLLLKEYDRRMELLTRHSPFEEINLAYLNEDYNAVEKKIGNLQKEGFLKPILSGIDGSLFENSTNRDAIDSEIRQSGQLVDLVQRARMYEKKYEYKKALDIYENLLVFRTNSYDREMIIGKLHSIWLALEQEKQRREENTRAIKYINSARILGREGKDADALEYYRMLLQECPNSDYIQEAVEGIIKITSMQKIPG